MKKYLTLAAVLGAIAFVSVSFLAQADDHGTHSATTTTTTITSEETAPVAAADIVAAECEASVAAAHEGQVVSVDEKSAALQACIDATAAEAAADVAPAE